MAGRLGIRIVAALAVFAGVLGYSLSPVQGIEPVAGSLDTTFIPGSGANATVFSVVSLSDGKVLIGGDFTSYNGTTRNRVARLNADGSLDTTFIPGSGANATVYSVVSLSDGKVLIGGNFTSYNGTTRNRVARLNADGSLDTSFDPGSGANAYVYSVVSLSDGKFLIGGNFTTYNGTTRNRVARLNADGSLDTSFDPGSGANAYVHSVLPLSDGKVLIGGDFTTYSGTTRNRLARLNDNGSLDTSFNTGTGANVVVLSVVSLSDGQILIGGNFSTFNGTTRNRVARLNADGSLDTSFNTGTGASATVRSVVPLLDDKILIGGDFTTYNGTTRNRVARLNADGSLDTSFNSGTGAAASVYSVVSLSDGKILIGGNFTTYDGTARNRIARLNAAPVLAPGAPTGVLAFAGNAQVSVSWTAPQGSLVKGYTVTASPGGASCTTTGALTCVVSGLTNGTGYTFTVVASNAVGNSPASTASALVTPSAKETALPGDVTGLVFDDYDVNGVRRTVADTTNNLRVEPGVAGVIVRAFDNTGALVGATTTAGDGSYSLNVFAATTNAVRIEFTVPDGYQPSFAANGTGSGGSTIRFVDLGTAGATQVNLGIHVPDRYCEANPLVVCTLLEDTVGTFGSLRGFNWDNSGSQFPIATNTETGALWGLAWHKQSRKLFSAPTVRRNTKVYESPEGSPRLGQIFVSGTSLGTAQPYVDVASLGVDVGTIPNYATRMTLVGGVRDGFAPNGTWNLTGKVGIGDVDVSADGRYLWFINLHDRKLYRLDIGGGVVTPGDQLTAADVKGFTPPDPGCVGGVYRPWAIGVHSDGTIFVGGVCTAESGGTRANLEAVVYRFDPNSEVFASSPVLRFRLDYTKGNAHFGGAGSFNNQNNRWYTWWETPNLSTTWYTDRGAMPILSDIVFSDDGHMSLGFIDRMAQRSQTFNSRNTGLPGRPSITDWFWTAGGDILRACTANQQTWQIEPLKPTVTRWDCTINGVTYFTGKSWTGQQSGEQEFYNDTAVNYSNSEWFGEQGHMEGALGGLATYPGATHVVSTFYDPNGKFFTGGARWFSQIDGGKRALPTLATGDRELVAENTGSESFGKAGGIGDIEILCSMAPVQVGNRIWFDTDGDGVQDPGEPPIAGVTVNLYDSAGVLVATTQTDSNGEYYFSSVGGGLLGGPALQPFAEHTIRLDNPADYEPGGPLFGFQPSARGATTAIAEDIDEWINSKAVVVPIVEGGSTYGVDVFPQMVVLPLAGGFIDHSFDAGFRIPSVSVGDRVWFDTDNDGVQDEGEPGLAGVTLTITSMDGSAVFDVFGNAVTTTTTDANGNYSFDYLPPGQYKVTVTPPAGMAASPPGMGDDPTLDSSTGSAMSEELQSGDSDMSLDFGFHLPTVSVGDRVWFDADNDGVQDPGESGIAGVTLTITTVTGSAVFDVFGNAVTTTTTDANGNYSFDYLPPGQYKVTVTPPTGFVPTNSAAVSESATSVTLSTNGASDLTLDFGFRIPSVSVGDRVWFDTNNDGVQDPGEPGIAGVTLTITTVTGAAVTDVFGNAVTTTTTDANGNYLFADLPLGEYKVTVTPPAGMDPSPPNVGGDPALDSSTGSATSAILTNDGDSDLSLDFGFWAPRVSVGDRVWFDTDNDGIQDAGEPGLAGVKLTIAKADGSPVTNVFGVTVSATTTDANGKYLFADLPPGEYKVTVTPPAGMDPSPANRGGDPTLDSSTGFATSANLTNDGDSDLSLDFGFWTPPAIVGGRVWSDLDRDGLIGPNEPGLAGVTVSVSNADGSPVVNVNGVTVSALTTDVNGAYFFDDLPFGGQYVVTVTEPSGFVRTILRAGNDPIVSSAHGSATSGVMTLGDGVTPSNLLDQTLNFGFVPPVSVGDRVWFDTNNNGIQDAGEPGIAGVTVTLSRVDGQTVVDVDGQPVTTTMTTDANGIYLFANLAPAEYRVTVTPPPGLTPSPAGQGTDPTLDSSTGSATSSSTALGVSDLTLDFGFHQASVSVGDRVWFDLNNDGAQDPGEPGIAGVTVTLSRVDGQPVVDVFGNPVTTTITTDANGNYLFANLPVGQYRVTASTPSGMTATTPVQQTSVTLTTNGASDLTLDFGFRTPTVSVGDRVWFDTDRNGVQDPGEPGIAGVTLTITKADGSAVLDVLGNPVTTTTTDANGGYLFTDLPIGQYKVTVTPPDGLTATSAGQGGDPALDSSTGFEMSTNLTTNGASDRTLDFGFYASSVSLGDRVWFDTNNDGIQDVGELGIPGVTLTITKADGSAVTDVFGNPVTTTTDANGNYLFADLPPGQYTVTVTPPNGVNSSTPAVQTSTSLVTNDESDLSLDFGFYTPSVSVGDRVWFDTNNDGIQDVGELGIPGVTLTITKADGSAVTDVFGNPVTTTTTDANGNYLFADLPPGQYTVTVTPPVGMTASPANEGDDPALDSSTGFEISANLTTNGASDRTLDFGFFAPRVSVGDRVWFDADNDGIQDDGEPGIYGVVLTITKADGSAVTDIFGRPVSTTTTDANGNYLFADLPLGEYKVTVTPPVGMTASPANEGGDPTLDSSTGFEMSANLTTNGASDLTLDFGFHSEPSAVAGVAWIDIDNNGLPDASEPVLPGVIVSITYPDGSPVLDVFGRLVESVTTDADGRFEFEDLVPGQYAVSIAVPSNRVPTVPPAQIVSTFEDSMSLEFGLSQATASNVAPTPPAPGGSGVVSVSVGDRVWFDIDNDGVQDAGELGIAGVTLTITKADGSAVTDIFGRPVTTTVTDANGNFLFANLPLGQYTVMVTPPHGFAASNAAARDGRATSTVLLTDGASDRSLDFGFVVAAASVAGNVWSDPNRDGRRSGSEMVVAGVEVMLLNLDGSPVLDVFGRPVASRFTDADGNYRFEGLPPGSYIVVIVPPVGMAPTNVAGTNMWGRVALGVVLGPGDHLTGFDVGLAVLRLPVTGSGHGLMVVALWLLVFGLLAEVARRRLREPYRPG